MVNINELIDKVEKKIVVFNKTYDSCLTDVYNEIMESLDESIVYESITKEGELVTKIVFPKKAPYMFIVNNDGFRIQCGQSYTFSSFEEFLEHYKQINPYLMEVPLIVVNSKEKTFSLKMNSKGKLWEKDLPELEVENVPLDELCSTVYAICEHIQRNVSEYRKQEKE